MQGTAITITALPQHKLVLKHHLRGQMKEDLKVLLFYEEI